VVEDAIIPATEVEGPAAITFAAMQVTTAQLINKRRNATLVLCQIRPLGGCQPLNKPPSNRVETPFVSAMEAAGMPEPAIRAFLLHLRRYLSGETGMLNREAIEPVAELPSFDDLGVLNCQPEALNQTVVIKLNGGLGTSMGLERAKSLIEVRSGRSFLDLIVHQTLALRRSGRGRAPLLFMNSFRTNDDTHQALAAFPDLAVDGIPLGFLQHQTPKIVTSSGEPAHWAADPELEWCPPGHGDIYTALATSGVLDILLDAGYRFAFISNSDNLGAVLEPVLLDFMVRGGHDFMMEVADRTSADRKGGHMCRLRDGRLALRESAQCPPDEVDEFQNIERFRFFNANNIWISLPALAEQLQRHAGVLPLHTIVNTKNLDPRDPSSPPVVQLETAMGAAISLFDRATAIRVPRRRFSPVKNTNDLLGVRSDAYELTEDGRVVLTAGRTAPPTISLDSRYFKLLDAFDRRFITGPPSLIRCRSLTVHGDITFGEGVVIEGDVVIRGGHKPSRIAGGTVLRSEHRT
jgi:UTP--glucose-1-phosphate uridylyltransferase